MQQKRDLCLVCFQENEFLETIFPTFPCLVNIKKVGQKKVNSGQRKKKKLYGRKVFSFSYSKENTFLFFIDKTCTVPKYKSLNSLSLPNHLCRSIEASLSFLLGNFFFPKMSLFISCFHHFYF